MNRRSPPGFVASALAALLSLLSSTWRLAAAAEPAAAPIRPAIVGPVSTGAGASDDGNVVEAIDPNAPGAASPPSAAFPAELGPAPAVTSAPRPPPPYASATALNGDRFELHGWARQSLEVGLSKRSPGSNDSDGTALPYDQLTARSQLFIRARYSHANWFEANVSGVLSYSFLEQAPARAETTFNGVNGQSTRGVLEPQLYELSVGLFTSRLDVRIGQQRVAWGNSDFMSPNDVINARDLRDPFTSELELRRIPTFMLRADLDLGFATLQGIIAPVFTPDRYDVYGSNWAAVQPDAPIWARGIVNIARRSLDPTLQESAQRLLLATRYPKSDLTDPMLGARLSWSAGGVDVNYYYQYGFDGPLIQMDPGFAASLASIDFNHAGLVDLEPWLVAIDAGQHPLQASYVRRHHIGTDLATTLGPIAIRVDAAYESKRVFFRRDLIGAVSPTLQGVLSTEYQTGDKDKLALLEVVYVHLVDAPPVPLLIYDRNTLGLGADLRWPIWRALGFAVRGLIGITPRMATVQPEVKLKFDAWEVSAGGLWLDGEPYSLGQYFHRNIEGYAKAKLLF